MKSTDLIYFLEIAATPNLSRAAERLGLSQPSLSLAVQRLESTIGTQLILRTKTGVRLTRAGEVLAARARGIVNSWEDLKQEVLRQESEIRGRYVIGCHPSVALYSLSAFLGSLMREHRELEIKLVHDLSRRITEEVISFRVDFGIVVNAVNHPDLVIRPLCKDEVRFWTSRHPTPLQSLTSGEGVLLCDPDLGQTQTLLKSLSKSGLAFRRLVTSSNLEVLASLTAGGCGIGVIPGRVVAGLPQFDLVPAASASSGPSLPKFPDALSLVYRVDVHKSAAGKALAKIIATKLKEHFE